MGSVDTQAPAENTRTFPSGAFMQRAQIGHGANRPESDRSPRCDVVGGQFPWLAKVLGRRQVPVADRDGTMTEVAADS